SPSGVQVLEFNARFGDPEAQVVLPRLEDDLIPLLEATARGALGGARPAWSSRSSVGVVLASRGYPGTYQTGFPIDGLGTIERDGPLVGIVMGSESDRPTMQRCCEVLDGYGISYEVVVRSAHRDPEGCRQWATQAEGRGLKVLIAAAGGAAHLPGVVAAWSLLPVIGVPMSAGALGGLDALLSMAQMPAGIPVATVAIGEAGADRKSVV